MFSNPTAKEQGLTMGKRLLSVAAIWLALIALVFVYTDREEYLWRFEGEDVALVLRTCEQAQAAEEAAAQAMQAQREAAQARAASGEWSDGAEYSGASGMLPAVGENGGLNLMWGDYDVSVRYASPEPFSLSLVSALRQSFIGNGDLSVPAGEGEISARVTLTDSTQGLFLSCDLPEGARIEAVTVHRAGAGVFSRDLAAYAALAGVVLTALLALSWDRSPEGSRRRRDAVIVVCAALFASMPCLWGRLYEGHDLFFHLNRIEGIASGLRAGQFPVRIHASTLLGYGYASSEFYPELFLYLPALMRNLGVSLTVSVLVFEMAINLATAAVCYVSVHRLLGSRAVAAGASVLYTLSVYRMANLYVRATLGESLAMIFFPLLILAMVEVLTRDERQWPLLALAMTGIFLSHLLSTMFTVLFCALAALCCLPRLVREPRRILAILKAAALMALCSAWFLVPFLSYAREGISTSVVLNADEHVLKLGSYLVSFSGDMTNLPEELEDFAYTIGVVPGLAILMGCALLLLRRYAAGRAADARERLGDRLSLALMALGTLALLGATDFFPWSWACSLRRPFSTLFMQIQFPWRLVGIASPMLSIAAAWGYLKAPRERAAGMAALVVLSVILSGYTMQCFVQQEPVLAPQDFCDTRIKQYEYTYAGTTKSALEPGRIADGTQPYAVEDFVKRGTSLTCTIVNPGRGAYIELPLLYYPGYRAQMDGAPCQVQCGTNNVIRLFSASSAERAELTVWFEPPLSWLAAQGVSLAGALLMLLALWRSRRAARR